MIFENKINKINKINKMNIGSIFFVLFYIGQQMAMINNFFRMVRKTPAPNNFISNTGKNNMSSFFKNTNLNNLIIPKGIISNGSILNGLGLTNQSRYSFIWNISLTAEQKRNKERLLLLKQEEEKEKKKKKQK